jgi:hypothetical protein
MANVVANSTTSLSSEEVIVRAVQFFSTEKFRTSSQSSRAATFDGRPPIPWFTILFTILGFMLCIIPGLIMYFLVVRKMYRFQNLVVTVTPSSEGADVSISHPSWAANVVKRFIQTLPAAVIPPVG